MILPGTSSTTLLLLILAMFCFAAWPITQKASGRWRFELYYMDLCLGMLLTSIVLSLTLGSMGTDLSVEDNLSIAGKRQMAFGLVAGAIFTLANMLLSAAISVAGMSVSLPISYSVAMILGIAWSFFGKANQSPAFLAAGTVVLGAGIAAMAMAHSSHTVSLLKTLPPSSRRRRDTAGKGILLSCISGFVMSFFFPMSEMSRASEIGLGAYTAPAFISLAALLTVVPLNLYFMNLPVSGEPVRFAAYFRGSAKAHILGLLGGAILCSGLTASIVAVSATKVLPSSVTTYSLLHGAPLLAVVFGTLIWKEFGGASGRTPLLLAGAVFLFAMGLGLLATA